MRQLDENLKKAIKKLNKSIYSIGCALIRVEISDLVKLDEYNEIKDMLDKLEIAYWENNNQSNIEIDINDFLLKENEILQKYSDFDWLVNNMKKAADLNFEYYSVKLDY